MVSRSSRGYGGRRRLTDPLSLFENQTAQTKKCFMYDHILVSINSGRLVNVVQAVLEGYKGTAYIFADLPFNCKAVYINEMVVVAKSMTNTGVIQVLNDCVYSIDGRDFLLSNTFPPVWEYKFVSNVLTYLEGFFGKLS